ncbi:hypothetical protein ACFQ1L_34985 [Phytohabitans flavus]|uniref:hypothetical protein n=1 Tax=Phytohabitans flavus TaxID=1076124 RepID=UPI003628D6BF
MRHPDARQLPHGTRGGRRSATLTRSILDDQRERGVAAEAFLDKLGYVEQVLVQHAGGDRRDRVGG